MKLTKRNAEPSAPAPLAPEAASTAATKEWAMPTGSYDLLGDRFNVRSRARAILMALAGGAFVATAGLGLQAYSARSEADDLKGQERTRLEQRSELSTQLQAVSGSGGFTQEQLNAHIAARRSVALAVAALDPAVDGLLDYLAASLPAGLTLTSLELAPAAAAKPAASSPSTTVAADSSTTSTTTPPAAAPAGWTVTLTASAATATDVSTFERVLLAAPQLRDVSASWSDSGAVTLTATATLAADPSRVEAVNATLGVPR